MFIIPNEYWLNAYHPQLHRPVLRKTLIVLTVVDYYGIQESFASNNGHHLLRKFAKFRSENLPETFRILGKFLFLQNLLEKRLCDNHPC